MKRISFTIAGIVLILLLRGIYIQSTKVSAVEYLSTIAAIPTGTSFTIDTAREMLLQRIPKGTSEQDVSLFLQQNGFTLEYVSSTILALPVTPGPTFSTINAPLSQLKENRPLICYPTSGGILYCAINDDRGRIGIRNSFYVDFLFDEHGRLKDITIEARGGL